MKKLIIALLTSVSLLFANPHATKMGILNEYEYRPTYCFSRSMLEINVWVYNYSLPGMEGELNAKLFNEHIESFRKSRKGPDLLFDLPGDDLDRITNADIREKLKLWKSTCESIQYDVEKDLDSYLKRNADYLRENPRVYHVQIISLCTVGENIVEEFNYWYDDDNLTDWFQFETAKYQSEYWR